MIRQIPNIITLLNLFSGCIAIAMAFAGNFQASFIWIVIAAGFDFFDGFAARLLGVSSKLGVELDSLADVVSFGVAPAAALFVVLSDITISIDISWANILPYSAFLIPAFSAYRLAKFNIDTRQTTSFLGLPTPANGLFWISYAYALNICNVDGNETIAVLISIGLVILMSVLMVSELPMFSLKLKGFTFKSAFRQIITGIAMLILVVVWGISGVAGGIVVYILISMLTIKRA